MPLENYQCGEHEKPMLSERLEKAMSLVDKQYPDDLEGILGSTIPMEYLEQFKYISCMKCYFCNSEDLYHLELMPVMVWTYNYLYVFSRYHDDGSVISVHTFSEWQTKCAPHLFDRGKQISLEDPADLGD